MLDDARCRRRCWWHRRDAAWRPAPPSVTLAPRDRGINHLGPGGDPLERLPAALVARREALLLRARLGARVGVLGGPQLLLQVRRVELLRGVRLLDEDQRSALRHLQVALALRVADDLVLRAVEPQLRRVEH